MPIPESQTALADRWSLLNSLDVRERCPQRLRRGGAGTEIEVRVPAKVAYRSVQRKRPFHKVNEAHGHEELINLAVLKRRSSRALALRTTEACRMSFAKTRLWSGSASAERAKTLASGPFCVREDVSYFRIADQRPSGEPIPGL